MKSTSNSRTTLTYLGVAGWHVQTQSTSLIIDPYFTRLSYSNVMIGRAIPETKAVQRYTPLSDVILVSHPHYDHIMDVPEIVHFSGASVLASLQGCNLLKLLNVPENRLRPISPGESLNIGDISIQVFETLHRKILGDIPYKGPLNPKLKPPLRARDYRMDEQFSFLIEANGLRTLVASGIDSEPAIEADVLLVGPDAKESQLSSIIGATSPRLVFPNHWDDMFQSLERPIRPMISPPPTPLSPLRRIDLNQFKKLLAKLAPQAHVILPIHFTPYHLEAEIEGSLQG